MSEHFANQALTTLTTELAKGATTLSVASTARFPAEGNFRILVDSELLMVTAVEGTTFTVERGIEETADIAHASGSTVTQVLTAGGLANKADLDEGALRESELPSSVVLASQLPAIPASRYGVSPARTGAENKAKLEEAIEDAEGLGLAGVRIVLPPGNIKLAPGIPLISEEALFSYMIEGSGYATNLEIEGEFAFLLNIDGADAPIIEGKNLARRLLLDRMRVTGLSEDSSLVRTSGAAVEMEDVRLDEIDYGVYLLKSYIDHMAFREIKHKSERPNGWLFYMAGGCNGDGYIFEGVTAGDYAARLRGSSGAVLSGCINGNWQLDHSGVTILDHHFEAGNETAPGFTINDSRVDFVSCPYLEPGGTYPVVKVENESTTLGASVVSFEDCTWITLDQTPNQVRVPHIELDGVSGRDRFIFRGNHGACVSKGTYVFDPADFQVASGIEELSEVLSSKGHLLSGNAEIKEVNDQWAITPLNGIRSLTKPATQVAILSTFAATEQHGSIENGTTFFYRLAIWDGLHWSLPSAEKEVEATADETAFALTCALRVAPCRVRIWRGSETGKYDRYVDLNIGAASTRLFDLGGQISGRAWIAEEEPTPPDEMRDGLSIGSRQIYWDSAAPTEGDFNQGDIVINTGVTAGGSVGWVCVAGGESPTWKTFGAVAE